jgi:hypothetical protein
VERFTEHKTADGRHFVARFWSHTDDKQSAEVLDDDGLESFWADYREGIGDGPERPPGGFSGQPEGKE